MKNASFMAIIALLLTACSASPPQPLELYLLDARTPVQAGVGVAQAVGLGPLKWPDYLTRRGLVTRSDGSRLDVSEQARWAEPLDAGFERVLRENLARRAAPQRLQAWPWPLTDAPAIQVPLEVLQFDASAQGEVLLRVRWRVVSRDKQELLAERGSEYRVKAAGPDAAARVAAHSEALARLGDEIGSALLGLHL